MARTRVLIVEDSLTVRKYLAETVAADPDLEVVGEAEDGKQAIDLCTRLRPDVVTLDIVLPAMSGLAVTEYIMAYIPTPILIVSSSANRGDLFKTYDALAAGAVDAMEKPRGDGFDDEWKRLFVANVKLVAGIKVITHPRLKLGGLGQTARLPQPRPQRARPGAKVRALVAIGASTGGPGAVLEVLRGLGPRFPLPILVVVHVGELFAMTLADWLDAHSPIRVRLAEDGDPLPAPGRPRALVAPPGRHLVIRGNHLRLTSDPERNFCRPSVDTFFESVASEVGEGAIACLLTGMGRDGADGLLAVKRAGGVTVAQDEATSVVFGMPGEAVRIAAADHVLPLGEIAPLLAAMAESPPGRSAP